MFSKKSTYDNYMGKVKDEIADPEVSVSRKMFASFMLLLMLQMALINEC